MQILETFQISTADPAILDANPGSSDIHDMYAAWVEAFGDPSDLEVEARIAETVNTLRAQTSPVHLSFDDLIRAAKKAPGVSITEDDGEPDPPAA